VPDLLTRWLGWTQTAYYDAWHRDLHTLMFAGAVTALGAALAPAGARVRTAALCCVAFHLHLLCDAMGSRGPDDSQWPIPYLAPFSDAVDGMWSWQWRLDGWQNIAITLALLVVSAIVALRRGRSVVGVVSSRADAAVVETLRRRFA
jgi:inner membrane protein